MLTRLKSTGLLCFVLGALLLFGGCASDFRKGKGPALVYKTELRFLDGPMSNQVTLGSDSTKRLVGHPPPDFSDSEQDRQSPSTTVEKTAHKDPSSRRVRRRH